MRLCFGHKYKLADGMPALAQLYVLYSDKARSFNQWQRVLYSNFYDTIRANYVHIYINNYTAQNDMLSIDCTILTTKFVNIAPSSHIPYCSLSLHI